MVVQVGIGVIAAALVVVVAFTVPVLTHLRRLTEESERLLRILNQQVPLLLQGAILLIRTTNGVVRNVKQGTAGLQGLGMALQDIGATVDQVHQSLRDESDLFRKVILANAAGVLAGIRAALESVKDRTMSSSRSYAILETEKEMGGQTRQFCSTHHKEETMVGLLKSISLIFVMALFLAGCQTMTGETAGQNLDDSAITAAVKTNLAKERIGSLAKVEVDTVRSTVYLTGVVDSNDYKEKAGQIARDTNGVQRVVNNLQVRSAGSGMTQ
jgi:hyperosmotically inducible periplasmic protein